MFRLRLLAAVLISSILTIPSSDAYVDGNNEDLVIDAPWRTIRDYLPVLFFTPEFKRAGLRIEKLELYNYDRTHGKNHDLIFEDNETDQDRLNCGNNATVAFIDANGSVRAGHSASETLGSHWHYIARVPVDCIGVGTNRGRVGEHYLYGRVSWSMPNPSKDAALSSPSDPERLSFESSRVLRVLIAKSGFVKFSAPDRYYDIHVHTIAEQTTWGLRNVNSSRKNFGGPLAMLMESAYALGLVDIQLKDGNWRSFKARIATTDHNVFFSKGGFDSGSAPGDSGSTLALKKYGPTSTTNGHSGEFSWYRKTLGDLGAEEVTLEGSGRVNTSGGEYQMGSHFLVYGAPHFEGPWHGGKFEVKMDWAGINIPLTGVENPLDIDTVMHEMSATNGFGYAAHPFSRSMGWSRSHFDRALGFKPYNDGGPESMILQSNRKDFVFKGSQIWNEKTDMESAAHQDGKLLVDSDTIIFDPFTTRDSGQVFVPNEDWDKSLTNSRTEYFSLVEEGLAYRFKQRNEHWFIRKLYMSGGTDAHGDFNYLQGNELATTKIETYAAVGKDAEVVRANNNAFGRVRTYTLTSERKIEPGQALGIRTLGDRAALTPLSSGVDSVATDAPLLAPPLESVMAYREGNTVLTDGPICTISTDANCRFNSDSNRLKWHDQVCAWENYDGLIGGKGQFDGGGTMLVSDHGAEVWVKTKWNGRNDYYSESEVQPDSMLFETYQITRGPLYQNLLPSGERSQELASPYTKFHSAGMSFSPSAVVLQGTLGSGTKKSMCLTNPIWTAPYRIFVQKPDTCPIKPNELKVSISFGISMYTNVRNPLPDGGGCVAVQTDYAETGYRGARLLVKPLDDKGQSTATAIELSDDRMWCPHNLAGPGMKRIQEAVYSATNSIEIPCAVGGWDSDKHRAEQGVSSYAVIATDLLDMHMNRLNAVASTFLIDNRSATGGRDLDRPATNAPIGTSEISQEPGIGVGTPRNTVNLRITDQSMLGAGVVVASVVYRQLKNRPAKITVSVDPPFSLVRQGTRDSSTVLIGERGIATKGTVRIVYKLNCNVTNAIAGQDVTARYTIHSKISPTTKTQASFGPALAEVRQTFPLSKVCAVNPTEGIGTSPGVRERRQ